ncbi:hydroxymethylbilane synthase [Roseibacillus ishigakijimensis]|uniref:Hydroxymethylbilane synthase n=1 Tax=Roseibacillus ishigakijimensis TaxID=454146 RepID=A0A934VMT6_9BACT|nr:hydroxymethylbilane synthase [Roseibacillus ishigakijimensis]MBK1834617.1 hydroxymethylbilane synthase [Roseibacillus ishigakijimensis]
MSTSLTLGTRGSALALRQAEMTEAALAGHCKLTREVIVTTGDRRTDIPLAAVAAASGVVDKGVFIKELEVALLDGEIDFAVHSLKDVPTILEPDFEICAVLPRARTGDVLITRGPTLEELPAGATIATSSVRRRLQLLRLRPDLQVVDIRGNVPTRLQKVISEEGLDGTILAEAGLLRLGYPTSGTLTTEQGDSLTAHLLDREEFLPAAGQGAVAMEILKNNNRAREVLAHLNDEETMVRITAERHFLALLQAGCDTPVGIDSRLVEGELHLFARVFEDDGSHRSARAKGRDALATAQSLFDTLA